MDSFITTNLFGTFKTDDLDEPITTFNVRNLKPLGSSTSKGNQQKWFDIDGNIFIKGPFEYRGTTYKDFLCEVIASSVGTQLGFDIIPAKICKIDLGDGTELTGSFTKNFLLPGEEHITFYRLLTMLNLTTFSKDFDTAMSAHDRVLAILEIYKKYCGIDASQFLFEMVTLDYLIGNEDRHMNNFGVIRNPINNEYRTAPLFDHGLSLFEHDPIYDGEPLNLCMKKMRAKPISTSFEKAYQVVRDVTGKSLSKNKVSLRGLAFPNPKAVAYMRIVSKKIGIDLNEEGVQYV